MAPEHGYNPFNSPEFRKEMSDMLDTKLSPLTKTVDEHEEYIQQQKGGGRLIHYLWTAALALLGGWFGGKGH